MLLAGVLLLGSVSLHAAQAISRYNSLSITSGAWITLATDLSKGTFYRPLIAEDGFGGTRFFPLQFICHAVLIHLGLNPFVAGHILSVSWTILLLTGMLVYLLRWGAPLPLAVAGAIAGLATAASFLALTEIRGDVLPAALNVWGLSMLAATSNAAHRRVGLAAVFFVLAWAAKITTVFGFAAGVVALLACGDKRAAWRLAIFTALGYAIVFLAIQLASGGRAIEIFRVCASGDGDINHFVHGPIRLAAHYVRRDPVAMVLAVGAFGGAIGRRAVAWKQMPTLALIATLGVTLMIFGSPGTDYNHLLDLEIASILFLVAVFASERMRRMFVKGLLTIVFVCAAAFNIYLYCDDAGVSRRDELLRVVADIRPSPGPILSQDALVPIVADETPYVLDAWMLRIVANRDASVMKRLAGELHAKQLRAVVLLADPRIDGGKYLDARAFGAGFARTLLDNYELSEEIGRYKLYLPKG
jgi:hypothetical protein